MGVRCVCWFVAVVVFVCWRLILTLWFAVCCCLLLFVLSLPFAGGCVCYCLLFKGVHGCCSVCVLLVVYCSLLCVMDCLLCVVVRYCVFVDVVVCSLWSFVVERWCRSVLLVVLLVVRCFCLLVLVVDVTCCCWLYDVVEVRGDSSIVCCFWFDR